MRCAANVLSAAAGQTGPAAMEAMRGGRGSVVRPSDAVEIKSQIGAKGS